MDEREWGGYPQGEQQISDKQRENLLHEIRSRMATSGEVLFTALGSFFEGSSKLTLDDQSRRHLLKMIALDMDDPSEDGVLAYITPFEDILDERDFIILTGFRKEVGGYSGNDTSPTDFIDAALDLCELIEVE